MQLGKQIIIIFILTILTGIFSYSTRIILANNLSVFDYGLFFGTFSLVFFFGFLRDFGLVEACVFYINKSLSEKKIYKIKSYLAYSLIFQMLFGILIALILNVLSPYLAMNYYKTEKSQLLIFLFSIFFVFDAIFSLVNWGYTSLGRVDISYLFQFFKFLNIFAFTLLFLKFNRNLNFAAFGYVLGALINIFLAGMYFVLKYKKLLSEKIEKNFTYLKELFGYGIQVMISSLGSIFLINTDILVLTWLRGNEDVGYYNIAIPIFTILTTFISPIFSFVVSFVAEKFHSKNFKSIERVLSLLYNYSLLVSLPLTILFASFPELIINTLFGEKYLPAKYTLTLFSMSLWFYTLRDVNFATMVGIGKVKERSKVLLISGIVNLILDIVLVALFGKEGAAFATFLCTFLMFYLAYLILRREFSFKLDIAIQMRIILCSIFFYFSIILFRKIIEISPLLEAIIVTLLSTIIYLLLLIVTKVINKERIAFLIKIMQIKFEKI
ncbi:MAG: flippase [Candidatus Woesearchaeota archaeon]